MIRDLLLGIRLAVGGGRMSGQAFLRLAMTTLGVALAVGVLLLAASVPNLVSEQSERSLGQTAQEEPRQGVDPLYERPWYVDTGNPDQFFEATVVAPSGPSSPLPPGLDRLPKPGEVMASPAAAELLASPDGAAVKARVGGHVVGEVGKPGLDAASDLIAFVGATPEQLADDEATTTVYGFGGGSSPAMGVMTVIFVAPLAVILLLPLLVFVTTASRMGAAERERRLAALRLVGLSAKQVRRVAGAESLVGAAAGLVVGGALFVVLRPLIGGMTLFGTRFFADDFVPPIPLVVAIVLLVPAIAVGAAIFGLRRTIVEPLGVVRHSKPLRRRMWWRWAVTAAGAAFMGVTLFVPERDSPELTSTVLAVGSGFLLIGVAALLPWAVERAVSRLRGGPPSWQLAVRRLQLESGTASRVVSGLVVVLAGAILIQSLIGGLSSSATGSDWSPKEPIAATVSGNDDGEIERLLAEEPAITRRHAVTTGADTDTGVQSYVGDCAGLAALADVGSCRDGDVFVVGYEASANGSDAEVPTGEVTLPGDVKWRAPATEGVTKLSAAKADPYATGSLLVTHGALGDVRIPSDANTMFYVSGDGAQHDVFVAASKAVSSLGWSVEVGTGPGTAPQNFDAQIAEMRGLLLTASLFVLVVAALSLLMLSIEQITERRRPLAALAAAGVPRAVLARGSLWQSAIPVSIGIVLSVAAGLALTWPMLRYTGLELDLDVGLLGMFTGAAALAVLVTTALSLPLLRQVTKLDGIRAE